VPISIYAHHDKEEKQAKKSLYYTSCLGSIEKEKEKKLLYKNE
jgi:hypothetical protein